MTLPLLLEWGVTAGEGSQELGVEDRSQDGAGGKLFKSFKGP